MSDYTVESNKNREELINHLEATLKDVGFGVLWKFDIHDKLADKGYTIKNKTTVLEVCNPEDAYNILEQDPKASYFLPCKIVVYEENDKTMVGFTKPSELMGLMGDASYVQFAKDIEDKLVSAVNIAI